MFIGLRTGSDLAISTTTGIGMSGAGGETNPTVTALFAATTTRPMDMVTVFFNPFSWTEFADSISYTETIWTGWNCSWAVPLVPTGGNFAEVIAGTRDSVFLACAQAVLRAAPAGTRIIVRIGWEFNGNWFGWSAGGQETAYINAFNRVVKIFRYVSSRFAFDLNLSHVSVGTACDIDAILAGVKHNLTFLGIDVYFSDGDSIAGSGSSTFGFHRDKTWGLTATKAAAAANGLLFSIPECAGPDSVPNYGSELFEWIRVNAPAYWAWWEGVHGPLNMRLTTGVNPLTLQNYKLRFGKPQITTSASQTSAENVAANIALTTAYAQTNTWSLLSGAGSITGSTLTIPGAPAGNKYSTVRVTNQFGLYSDLEITQTFTVAYTMTDSDAAAWVARRSTSASEDLKEDIDNLYIALKAAGAYSIAKEMWLAVDTEEASRFGMKGVVDRVPVNSPAFTAYEGFLGSGSAYVDLVAANAASPFVRNNAWVMIWEVANISQGSPAIGINASGAMELNPRNGSGNATLVMNDFTSLSVANASPLGIYSGIRSTSTARRIRKNGVTIASDTVASAYNPTASHFVEDASNSAFPAAHRLRFVLIGSAPSDAVEAATVAALQAWAAARNLGPARSLAAASGGYALTGSIAVLSKASASWPSAANTGHSGTLTSHSGDFNTSSINQVVNSLNVSGSINVNHSGVTVSNCIADTINIADAPVNVTIEDCTIIGTGTAQQTGIGVGAGGGAMIRRNDVSGCENGIYMNGPCTVRDNWFHGFAAPDPPEPPHYDGIATQGGASNMLVEHNFVDEGAGPGLSSCMFIQADFAAINNITVNNNKFIGGGYTCYAYDKNSHGMSGIVYTNNRLGGWFYGPLYGPYTIATWSGNVNDATDEIIPLA